MTRHYANNLIAAASIMHDIESLETIVSKLPTNEAQVRPLRRLSPEERRAVWAHVVGSHDASAPPTQAQVEHVAQALYPRARVDPSATTPPDGQPFNGAEPSALDAAPASATPPSACRSAARTIDDAYDGLGRLTRREQTTPSSPQV
jgi:hypothetical protein